MGIIVGGLSPRSRGFPLAVLLQTTPRRTLSRNRDRDICGQREGERERRKMALQISILYRSLEFTTTVTMTTTSHISKLPSVLTRIIRSLLLLLRGTYLRWLEYSTKNKNEEKKIKKREKKRKTYKLSFEEQTKSAIYSSLVYYYLSENSLGYVNKAKKYFSRIFFGFRRSS